MTELTPPNFFLVRSGLAAPAAYDADPALDVKAPETLYKTASRILELLDRAKDIHTISLRSSPARRARESAAVLERPLANDRFEMMQEGVDSAYAARSALASNGNNVNGLTRLNGVLNLEWLLERSVAAPERTAFVVVTHKAVMIPFGQLHGLEIDKVVPGDFVATRLNRERL